MAVVTGDRYLELLARFVEERACSLLDGTLILNLNPVGLHYVQARLEALQELEQLRSGAPVDYLRAYVADLGDHRALEKLRRVLRLLGSLQVAAVLPAPGRDPTPVTLLPFAKLRSLELRGCDLSTAAARGLLQLRPILEKLICHNSVNALRHIFAEQTVEINVAQKWTRLTAVACPCNRLVLMDESLQLLPAVDALDLSRNNFAKVANLQKCTRLKFLDLGFNHISSVASLNQVVASITKLILRNNALVSTRGIETLLSLEALDLSYNIISNFHEVEALEHMPVLESLWFNGNPISVSSHYREEVFSYFHEPKKLKVDGKPMTRLESWFMRGILSRRIKQRATYGIYVPAKSSDTPLTDAGPSEALLPQSRHAARKKRLASIADLNGASTLVDSAQQDAESEISSPGASDAKEQIDPEVSQLIQQIENMKREGSSRWLNDLVGFWDDKTLATSENGSSSQRKRRGKEEARRRLEDVAIPKELREAVHVLEPDLEDIHDMDSWQMSESGNDGAPASPPHYDSALMHRRQNLVNEMLRLPMDLSTSSDCDSDSVDEHQLDCISDRTNSDPISPSSVVDKQISFLESTSNATRAINSIDEDTEYSDRSDSESKGKWKTVSVAEESPAQSPQINSARKRKQKKATRRIVILDGEDDAKESSSVGYQTEIAPQLATPPSSLVRNLSQPFMSNRSSSLPPSSSVKRSSSALPGMVKQSPSSLAKTVEFARNLGNVNTS